MQHGRKVNFTKIFLVEYVSRQTQRNSAQSQLKQKKL